MGSDGASVMTGKLSGVVKRMADRVQQLIFAVHCSAHQLELAFKDECLCFVYSFLLYVTDQCNSIRGLNTTLTSSLREVITPERRQHRNSPLNRHNLKEAFKVFGRKPVMPTRVAGTRWLPHTVRALKKLFQSFGPMVTLLKQIFVCCRRGRSGLRTLSEIKKKYQNIKEKAKAKRSLSMRPPTGGGPRANYPSVPEQLVLDNLEGRPSLCGVDGGIDTDEELEEIKDSRQLIKEQIRVAKLQQNLTILQIRNIDPTFSFTE
ncbi:uncharacterized protein LOC124259448 [Haliotis rubra]|uniref:uncharacterized protein LOC124259448 n=1 Tax=Haliotis rubra TaxID=36100 RepID=UPI001EE51DC2|nr:uncharacterized protein LOC124259448 [Haliotis rubra]